MAYQTAWVIKSESYFLKIQLIDTRGRRGYLSVDISPKENALSGMELELTFYDVEVQDLSYYTTRTSS